MEKNKKKQKPANNGENLVQKGSNLASLLESSYIVMALDGTIIEANGAAHRLLGLTEKELLGHVFFDRWAVPNMGSALVNQVIDERLVRGFIADMKRPSGEIFVASINAQLVVDQQDYSKVIECLVLDISEGQKQQDEFAETLRTVTGGIAHVINNQMASVVGTADLVKMELTDRPELAAKLDRISKSGIQASDVAHNLVDFADTSDNIVMGEVYLKDVVFAVAKHYKNNLEASAPRKLSINIGSKLHRIFANEENLIKMLQRLLDNAIDATQAQGVIIISCKNVTLMHNKTGLNKNYVLLSVEDHGHGMNHDTQQHIFEPFFSTRFAGRGMSLAQVLKTIKKYHGQIRVKTSVGKGSVFKIYFPVME